MSSYTRSGRGRVGRTLRRGDSGRVARPNRRPGKCRECAELIPAGAGHLWHETDGAWSVVHVPAEQTGWLMHPGPMVGGCPDATDRRNAELHAAGFFGPDAPAPSSERDRIAAAAARYAAANPPSSAPSSAPARSGRYAYTSSGARMTDRFRRCEDAPCCGCCD